MYTIVIMISGKSESGKGTVATEIENILKEHQEYNVIRCSLSTYIRDIARRDFYWDGIDTPESRKFMAETYRVGTEFYPYHMARRVWERDIEPKLLHTKEIVTNLGYHQGIVRTGSAFIKVNKNVAIVESFREKVNYDFFKTLLDTQEIDKLTTLRVIRPEYESTAKNISNHVSEVDLDDFPFDFTIINDKGVAELQEEINKLKLDKYL